MEKKIDILDERLRVSELFDYYGILLKNSAGKLLESYIGEDLSLSEIAETESISRQGVHDSLKRSIKQLEDFDKKLKLIEKADKVDLIADKIRDSLAECENETFTKQILEELTKLENIF